MMSLVAFDVMGEGDGTREEEGRGITVPRIGSFVVVVVVGGG